MSPRPVSPDPLTAYRDKRDFARTSEPAGEERPTVAEGIFVVQKHWASRLHYDFRLALDGTLKSWAVPKGPSLNPRDKRMAVQVEDHPLAYADFEGTIPAGQYGAGRVIVWDHGTWTPLEDAGAGYRRGQLKFELHGHKLQGRWVLIRLKGRENEKQPPWLLIKEADAFARTAQDTPVVDALPDSVKSAAPPAPVSRPVKPARARRQAKPAVLPADARPAPLPEALAPQLATLAKVPPADPAHWLFEIKYDGYRLLARIDGAAVRLITRTGLDWTQRLPHLHQALQDMQLPVGWYDGEIVVAGAGGAPDFGALQRSFDAERTREVVYHLFDLPFCQGHDLRGVPFHERRALLQALLAAAPPSDTVRLSAAFDAAPEALLASACQIGLEGVIGKRLDSVYRGARSADWIKLKCAQRQAFVIGGYTEPQGTRTALGALLLGVYDEAGALRPVGKVGTGFSQQGLRQLHARLQPLRQARSPFAGAVPVAGRAHWVAPRLVAEVSFAEWTNSGQVRQAVFAGLRDDRDAREIVREAPRTVPPPHAHASASPTRATKRHPMTTSMSTTRGKGLRVTHPERVIDPQSGFTKGELVRYYERVAALMVPQLKGRPVSLLRAPGGLAGETFFQKHAGTDQLPGVRSLDPALDPGHAPLIEIGSTTGLLSAAQWNVLEFHTQNATAADYAHPDRIVFDLDPGEGVPWAQVREAAELTRAFLAELGLVPFLKTSGGKGLHVVVPVKRQHSWAEAKDFSQAVVQHMSRTIPQRFVARSGPKNRVGKVFIDYLRNGAGATTVCAWSARARPGLGISVPLDWSELPGLRGGDHWTTATVEERLGVGNAPWKTYARSARALTTAAHQLARAR